MRLHARLSCCSATLALPAVATLIAGLAFAAPVTPPPPVRPPALPPAMPAQPAAPSVPSNPPTGGVLPGGGRPAPVAIASDPTAVTDEAIEQAITRGAAWLSSQFDAQEMVKGAVEKLREDESYAAGLDALA